VEAIMARTSLLDVATAETGPPLVLLVSGVVDIATAIDLTDGVQRHLRPGAEVVVDVSGVTLCDSTGLGAIVRLARAARTGGCSLALRAPRRHVREVLATTGIDAVVRVIGTQHHPT
jgi:anti-sigma B factor antagonist